MNTRHCWWLVSRDENGKVYLVFGSDKGESDAREHGLELLGGTDFEIKRLRTRNLATASSLLKGNRLEQTHSLRTASKRLGHGKSLRRLRRKRLNGREL